MTIRYVYSESDINNVLQTAFLQADSSIFNQVLNHFPDTYEKYQINDYIGFFHSNRLGI